MTKKKLIPAIRVDGGRRVNLKAIKFRQAAAEQQAAAAPQEPIEDDRLSRAWHREERRVVAAANASAEARAIQRERSKPRAIVRPVEVDNPYFQPEHAISPSNARKIGAAVNIRESAIETMFARGVIDQAQKKAADKFRFLWEAMGGKASSIDYTLDRVDGGRADPAVRRLTAAKELDSARQLLGARLYDLVCKVCGEGRSLSEIGGSKRDKLTAADNLRNSLNDLAEMWGLATRGRGKSAA